MLFWDNDRRGTAYGPAPVSHSNVLQQRQYLQPGVQAARRSRPEADGEDIDRLLPEPVKKSFARAGITTLAVHNRLVTIPAQRKIRARIITV